ncbi:hypothetical protein [Xanthomarina gelatinilytica]|uniref:hypothetical protein n=1 Tax=Xanthomarina gelatinilytica TaxID=1137281 RepID=UPI003AA9583E
MKYLLNSFILIFISISSVAQNANNKEFKSANENVFVKSPFSNYYKIEKEAEFINELNFYLQKDHLQLLFNNLLFETPTIDDLNYPSTKFNTSPLSNHVQFANPENPILKLKNVITPNVCLVIWEP